MNRELGTVLILFLVGWLPSLAAQDLDGESGQAYAYFESGDYAQSRALYEGLSDDGMELWKKEIISYNIATAMLAGGDIEEALLRFETLSDASIKSPLLKESVLSNLALARLIQLKQGMDALNKEPKATFDDYNIVYGLFRKVHLDIEKADNAWCSLEAAEGAEVCSPSSTIQEMRLDVKNNLNEFLDRYKKFLLLKQSSKTSTVTEVLQQLLVTYGLALIEDPLQKIDLQKILEEQTAFEEAFKKGAEASLAADYDESVKYLKLGIRSLNDTHSVNARIFAEAARFYLSGILEKIAFSAKKLPVDVLKNAIAKEDFILLLDQLIEQKRDADESLEIDRLMPELQQLTLDTADRFLEVVLARQKELFSAESTEKSRCQCHPWDEVIPLFSEGFANAQLANERLKVGDFKLDPIRRLQKKAVDNWKKALARMNASSAPKKSQQQESQAQQNQSEQQQAKEDRSPDTDRKNAKLNEIIRMVQDMENDDRSKPQQIKSVSGTGNGEERPW